LSIDKYILRMKNFIKIGNATLKDINVSPSGENTIYAKEIKEEFFGIYNVSIQDKNLICPINESNIVSCSVVIDNMLYENVKFTVIKSDKNKIRVNNQHLGMPVGQYKEPVNTQNESMFESREINTNTSADILFLIDNLTQEVSRLKSSIKVPEAKIDYRKITQFIKESIDDQSKNLNEEYKETIIGNFLDLYEKQELFFKDKVFNISEEVSRDIVKQVISEYEGDFRKEILQITEDNRDTLYKQTKNLYEKVRLELENIAEDMLTQKEAIIENLESKAYDITSSAINETNKTFNNIIVESNLKTEVIIQDFKNNINDNILSNKNDLKQIKETAENTINNIIIESGKKIDSLITSFDKNIRDKNNIIEEKLKKIEENVKANKDITKQIIAQTKKYTDTKTQEAIKYARILLDYAGGGGSVAVQYVNGGEMQGDLVVDGSVSADNINTGSISLSSGNIDGDLLVAGNITTYSSFLSGTAERNLLDIFAGEGPGDNNELDGGIF